MYLLSLAVQSPGTAFHIFVFVFTEEEARKAKGPSALESGNTALTQCGIPFWVKVGVLE